MVFSCVYLRQTDKTYPAKFRRKPILIALK